LLDLVEPIAPPASAHGGLSDTGDLACDGIAITERFEGGAARCLRAHASRLELLRPELDVMIDLALHVGACRRAGHSHYPLHRRPPDPDRLIHK